MHKLTAWAESHRDMWLDCVRIYLDLGLLARGVMIVFNVRTEFFINLLSQGGQQWLTSGLLLHYIARAHFIGGLLLAIGLFTRVAALVQIPILAALCSSCTARTACSRSASHWSCRPSCCSSSSSF